MINISNNAGKEDVAVAIVAVLNAISKNNIDRETGLAAIKAVKKSYAVRVHDCTFYQPSKPMGDI